MRAALLRQAPPRAREILVIGGLLGLLALAAYTGHVHRAGFVTDDWSLRKQWLARAPGNGLGGVLDFIGDFRGRPALGVYLAAVQGVLGFHQGVHLALAVGMAILLSVALYLLLRTLRLAPLHAGIIASLALVFPASDSLRLWAILGDGSWALSLLLLGAVLTLWSFEATGRRRRLLRTSALLLYAISLATYEIGVFAVALSLVIYRCRVPWRKAVRAWVLDLAVLALVYLLATRTSGVERLGLADTVDHGLHIARDAFELFGTQVLPFGASALVGMAVAVATIVAAGATALRLPADDARRRTLMGWLAAIGVASVYTVGAYAVYAPGSRYYTPLAPGLGNRVNALAALPLVTIAYALGALVGLLFFHRLPRWRTWAAGTAIGAGLVIGMLYLGHTRAHSSTWTSGYLRAQNTLNLMRARMPKPPRGSMVLAFGQSAQEAPGIPVWIARWDLDGAVAIRYHDLSLAALPAFEGTTVACGATSARPVDPGFPVYLPGDGRPYGRLYLFDARTGNWAAPTNRRACRRVAPSFVPARFQVPADG